MGIEFKSCAFAELILTIFWSWLKKSSEMRLLILYSLYNYPISRVFWCFFSRMDDEENIGRMRWTKIFTKRSTRATLLNWTSSAQLSQRRFSQILFRLKDGNKCVYGICICTYRYTWAYKYVIDSIYIYCMELYCVVLCCIVLYFIIVYYIICY